MRALASTAVVVLALGVAIGSVQLASASPFTGPKTMTLVAVDLAKSEVVVDLGTRGESPGDLVSFTELVYDRTRGSKAVGRIEVVCQSFGSRTTRCSGTMFLPEGTIEAAGGVRFTKTFRVPIVGGTKAYADARGELVITTLTEKRDRYVVRLVG